MDTLDTYSPIVQESIEKPFLKKLTLWALAFLKKSLTTARHKNMDLQSMEDWREEEKISQIAQKHWGTQENPYNLSDYKKDQSKV